MRDEIMDNVDEFEKAKQYWLKKLSGELHPLEFPGDFPRSKQGKKAGYTAPIGAPLQERLIRISKNNDLSLYILMLTVIKLVAARQAGVNDTIVASPIYNKSNREYNKHVVLRDTVEPDLTFKEFLLKVRQTVVDAYSYEFYPIRKLAKSLDVTDTRSLQRLVFLLETIHDRELAESIIMGDDNDIAIFLSRGGEDLHVEILYDERLFKEETIRQFWERFLRVAGSVLEDTGIPIGEIPFMTEDEARTVLVDFNRTERDYPAGKTLHRLFEEQVEQTPENMALVFDRETVTYRRLNEKANYMAAFLREKGVGLDVLVAVIAEQSPELVIALLGILKAGGAYLPIDSEAPARRIEYILKDSNAGFLLKGIDLQENFGFDGKIIHAAEVADSFASLARSGLNISIAAQQEDVDNLAYVIYTSGTTGKPKGILVPHRGIVNYVRWRLRYYRYSEADVTLQPLYYTFDGFGSNFYSTLLSGGTLVLMPDNRRLDFSYMKELAKEHNVTNTSLVPGMYRMFLQYTEPGELDRLRFVVLAGERCGADLVERSGEKIPNALLINEYGPTETSVTAAANRGLNRTNTAVLGKPIDNTKIFILDRDLNPLPVNVVGELCIAGAGLTRGCLNQPELTAEKFVVDNLSPVDSGGGNDRLYKTGDYARWLPDGTIEFFGRMDMQVKVRGNRIEISEVETQLLAYEGVKQAAVIMVDAAGDAGANLYAYFVPEGQLDARELRAGLTQILPDYMLPSRFIRIEAIPLTSTGKIDRKALAALGARSGTDVEYVAPKTKIEKTIAGIWREALQLEKVGLNDNFFDLGGNSLHIVTVTGKLKLALERDIPIITMFRYPTIHALVLHLEESPMETASGVDPGREEQLEEALNTMEESMGLLLGDNDE